MDKILYSRKFWFLIVASFIVVATITIYVNIDIIIINWFDSLKLIVGITGLLATLFNYWKKFNLFLTRVWIILTNSSAKWNVTVNFEGTFNEGVLTQIYTTLREKAEIEDYIQIHENSFNVIIDGLNYSFEYIDVDNDELTDTKGKLHCRIKNFNSSYDNSIKIFEEEIIPYFNLIERVCNPESQKYNFRISFKGKNPFVSLVAKNVETKHVNNLWYSFKEETKVGRRDVKLTENSLECTTTDITDFQVSSMKFISLVGD